MEKRLTILLTTISLLALPATAQENTLEMNCSTYDDNPPGPGESTSCLLEGFPSDFNGKNYTHDWSTSMGQVTQESVESAQISLPEQYSNSELMVKAEITDASGETYVAEKNVGLEEISDEGENQSYQTPVEDPVNNETQGEKILPQPEVYCPSEVNSGEKVRCNVTYSSDIAQPSYEWNVKGQGDVDGDLKHGTYVAPEVQEETEEVSLSLYSSSETNSASEKISVVPRSSDNSDQESSNDERLNRQSQKIEEQQETIRNQREKLRQRESTIEDLRSTVQDLRNQLNNLEEEDSESRENYEENGSEERQETEDAGGNDSKETKDEQVREEEQEAFNESGSDTQNSSERENDQDSSEVEFEEAEESSDELENENTTEGSSNQDSSGLIGALTSLFG